MSNEDAIQQTFADVLAEGVIVAVRLEAGEDALQVCQALISGGLRVLELTLTTEGALDAMTALRHEEDVVVGGGTVLTTGDVRRVAGAGGRFALSPVFDEEVVNEAHRLGLLAIPGAATPAEILRAYQQGASAVKVFPSGALGGPAFLRAVRGPLPGIPLIPTSGPTADDLADYLAAGAIALGVGGAELFPPGFTPHSVEVAARRVSDAYQKARATLG